MLLFPKLFKIKFLNNFIPHIHQSDSGYSVSFGGLAFFGAFHAHWPSMTSSRFTIENNTVPHDDNFFLLITIDMQIFPPLWNTKFSSSQLRFWLFQIPIKFVSSSCFAIADSGSAVQLVDWVYLFYQVPFGQYFMDDVLFEFY